MKRTILFRGITFGVTLLLLSAGICRALILSGSIGCHDPSRIIKCKGVYYVYSTGGRQMHSKDRIHWTTGPSAFPNGLPSWVFKNNAGVWAPDVIFLNGQYYMYYAVSTRNGDETAIGLQSNPTLDPNDPKYHWTDRGMVIHSTKSDKRGSIDPCPVLDTKKNLWLCYGSGYTFPASTPTIFVVRLNNQTGLLLDPKNPRLYPLELGHIEASYIFHHKGYYYLFWNSGGCCDGAKSTYTIHVARSAVITGPYVDKKGSLNASDVFLGPTVRMNDVNGMEHGPGQIGIYSEHGKDWFTYHYYPDTGWSVLGEERLLWGPDGWPVAGKDENN